jgi:hypothetical protein
VRLATDPLRSQDRARLRPTPGGLPMRRPGHETAACSGDSAGRPHAFGVNVLIDRGRKSHRRSPDTIPLSALPAKTPSAMMRMSPLQFAVGSDTSAITVSIRATSALKCPAFRNDACDGRRSHGGPSGAAGVSFSRGAQTPASFADLTAFPELTGKGIALIDGDADPHGDLRCFGTWVLLERGEELFPTKSPWGTFSFSCRSARAADSSRSVRSGTASAASQLLENSIQPSLFLTYLSQASLDQPARLFNRRRH